MQERQELLRENEQILMNKKWTTSLETENLILLFNFNFRHSLKTFQVFAR